MTPEVVVELRKFKRNGNTAIHDETFTRDAVVEAFADADPDREALMLKMLDACYTFCRLARRSSSRLRQWHLGLGSGIANPS